MRGAPDPKSASCRSGDRPFQGRNHMCKGPAVGTGFVHVQKDGHWSSGLERGTGDEVRGMAGAQLGGLGRMAMV